MMAGRLVEVAASDEQVFFEARIRPVLVQHCYECHSSGAAEVQGDLMLDFRDGIRRGGKSGPAVVPGKPAESLLMAALRFETFEMPPNSKLPNAVIADFERWISRGAVDPRDKPPSPTEAAEAAWKSKLATRGRWWSLQSPRHITPPMVSEAVWSAEPVDRFLWARLNEAKLSPAKPADAETLIRRLSFVLTGLPPKPATVTAFREAYARNADMALQSLVDDLLESPHFGERFARHWMDVVRYTDTYGYEWDNPAKGSWEYRDYLIRAFNDDIGFDQMIREQVAGDLLREPRINAAAGVNESLIGPMFYHMGEHRHGTSLDFNGIHQEMIDNKIDAFSKAFLAMTVACARCHDHKLDAISQTDYYALAGMFMTPRWTARDIAAPAKEAEAIAELKRIRNEIRGKLAQAWTRHARGEVFQAAGLRNWALQRRSSLTSAKIEDVSYPLTKLLNRTVWLAPKNFVAAAEQEGTTLSVDPNGSILAGGPIPATDTYTVRFSTGPGTANLLRLEVMTHKSLGNGGPGRTPHGNFVLTHVRVDVVPRTNPQANPNGVSPASRPIALASASADFSQTNYPVAAALDPSPSTGWGVGGVTPANLNRTAQFVFAEPIQLPYGGDWTVTLVQQYGGQHVIGHFRITPGDDTAAPRSDAERQQADREISDRWKQLAAEWANQRQVRQQANDEKFKLLTDFSTPGFPTGWVVDGHGLEQGFVGHGTPRVALEGDALVESLLPRGYHTHALSSKLAGAIRLPPPELLPGKYVSLKMAGGEWAGRIDVPQNAFQAENISFFSADAPATWQVVSARPLKNGVTRVLTEFGTSSLHPNFPPRTGLARAGDTRLPDTDHGREKRSWLSVTEIVAHETSGAPADTLKFFAPLYESPIPVSVDEAWQRLARWLSSAVDRWADGEAAGEDIRILNWLLDRQLLPNDFKSLPEVAKLVEQYRKVESRIEFARSAISMDERSIAPVNYRLNVRGNVDDEGPAIRRNFLEVFKEQHSVSRSTASGRLELAEYLASRDNPQTARVYVNRVWQWIFGTGIVATPNDFGKLGDRPSHPELLDWLAIRFMEEGWSTKRLVRRLVLSQAFRQSGEAQAAAAERDPDNRLLHHYPTRRLEAEAIRDSLLAVSGRLDPRLFGPPINPPRMAEDSKKRLFTGPWDGDGRRSLYITMSIMEPPKFLVGFNLPDLKLPTGRRDVTNVPAQALIMLNDPFVIRLSEHWAARLMSDGSRNADERILVMFQSALGRNPTSSERQRWLAAVQSFASPGRELLSDQQAWSNIAHALFNTKEFIYYR